MVEEKLDKILEELYEIKKAIKAKDFSEEKNTDNIKIFWNFRVYTSKRLSQECGLNSAYLIEWPDNSTPLTKGVYWPGSHSGDFQVGLVDLFFCLIVNLIETVDIIKTTRSTSGKQIEFYVHEEVFPYFDESRNLSQKLPLSIEESTRIKEKTEEFKKKTIGLSVKIHPLPESNENYAKLNKMILKTQFQQEQQEKG